MVANREKEFGLLIAYILPGFISLLAFVDRSELVQSWVGQSTGDAPSIGGFLFLTVASIFVGLVISTVRWLVLDTIHHLTGIRLPDWDFSRMGSKETSFVILIDIHYRYYQFYANSAIAVTVFFVTRCFVAGFAWGPLAAWLGLVVVFYLGSRDTLSK